MTSDERPIREEMIAQCRWMNDSGLNQGTSGNLSVRAGGRMLITPSATPYDEMAPEMIAAMPVDVADPADAAFDGPRPPSTEWRFHRDILRARPDIGAVVHTHSPYATAVAIAGHEIPPCHYMIAAFGVSRIRLAPYARFGTAELSAHAVEALGEGYGVLLANHGMIAAGETLKKAMWRAVELEALAKQYHLSLGLGGPNLLSEEQIAETMAAFRNYGLRDADKE